MAQMWARSVEDLVEVFESDFYRATSVPDARRMMEPGEMEFFFGWEEVKLDGEGGEGEGLGRDRDIGGGD